MNKCPVSRYSGKAAKQIHRYETRASRRALNGWPHRRQKHHVSEQMQDIEVKKERRKGGKNARPGRIEAKRIDKVGPPKKQKSRKDVCGYDHQRRCRQAGVAQASCNISSVMSTFT